MLSSLRSPEGVEVRDDFASRELRGMRVLPARFARLTRDFAIIFVGESFFAAAASGIAAGAPGGATITIFAAAAAATAAASAAGASWTAAAGFFRAGFVDL